MTPAEAAKLLELPENAAPEQVEARFHELRTKLEEKIGKAPTPGLKAKYRETLDEITAAFETLTLAADSSALPVLNKQSAVSDQRSARTGSGAGAAATPPRGAESENRKSRIENRKSGKEFIIVAVIAVVVLGAGGWWVVKTRAEKAEQARIAAEAKAEADRKAAAEKAEADRKAEEARLAAEAKRKAEEDEKARVAAAEKAEQERLERLTGQLRSDLAAAKVEWEAIEREERNAERRLSELKSDLRSLRDPAPGPLAEAQAMVAAQQDYYDWLSATIARHPARIARSRAEELLSARQVDAAQAVVSEFKSGVDQLQRDLPEERRTRLALSGALTLTTHPEAAWTLVDAFGRTRKGTGSASLADVAIGPATIEISLPLWPVRRQTVNVSRTKPIEVRADYTPASLALDSSPAGATVQVQGRDVGATPLRLSNLPPGKLAFTLKLPGHYDRPVELALAEGEARSQSITLRPRPTTPALPTRWVTPEKLTLESQTTMNLNMDRSSGSYAGAGTNSNSTAQSVEEWDFDEPDAEGVWQRAVRRFVLDKTTTPLVTPGSTIEYRRGADGTWKGAFLTGGVTNPAYQAALVDHYVAIFVPESVIKCWPPAGTPVGGTWSIPAELFYPVGAVHGGKLTRHGTGRLVSFNREPTRDWVELEFSYTVTETAKNDTDETRGVARYRVDLSGYVISFETEMRSSSTTRVPLVGALATDMHHRNVVTYRVR